jgi:hypothetical protein
MALERFEIAGVVGNVLAGVVTMFFHERRHLRGFGPVNAFNQRDPEIAVVDAPNFHAAIGISRANIVNAIDQGATLNFDVKPRPPLDRALFAGVGDMVNLGQALFEFCLHTEIQSVRSKCRKSFIKLSEFDQYLLRLVSIQPLNCSIIDQVGI